MLLRRYDRSHRFGAMLAVCMVMVLLGVLPALASVGLIFFEAHPGNEAGEVIVRWATESEADTVGFRVKRGTNPLVQNAMVVITVPNSGSASSGAEYEFMDSRLTAGQTYYYWLLQLTSSGSEYLLTQGVQVVAPGESPAAHHYYLPVMRHSF